MQESKMAKLVLVILVCVTLIIGFFVWSYHRFQYNKYVIFSNQSLNGMVPSSPVEMLGVQIGQVDKIELINPELAKIQIAVQKTAPMDKQIYAHLITRGLSGRGLAGYMVIELGHKSPSEDVFKPAFDVTEPFIPLVIQEPESLDGSVIKITRHVDQLSKQLNALFDARMIRNSRRLIMNLDRVVKMMSNNNHKLKDLIINLSNASGYLPSFTQTSSNTVKLLETQFMPTFYLTLTKFNRLLDPVSETIGTIEDDPSVIIRGTVKKKYGPGER